MDSSFNKIPCHLLEVGESFEQRFKPVLSFEGWRVAMLRHSDATECNKFHQVERHNQTNEVFILTAGKADLIICETGDIPGETYVFPMIQNVAYNIPPLVWHHVVMSGEAHIIIFERADTTRENSNYYQYQADQCIEIINLFQKF